MKNYIIINGKATYLISCKDIEEAKQRAINICDHSNEIIIREYINLFDFTIKL